MNVLTNIGGRILFSVPFLVFGIFHFMNANQMAGMVPLPGGIFWVYLTGAAQILAAISIYTKIQGKLAMLLLALLLLIYIAAVHIPNLGNPQMSQFALTSLLKDAGLMGGALILAGIFNKEKKQAQA